MAMGVCLMIEGQEGLTWERWRRLARAAEDGGFESLFRSDHLTGLSGDPKRPSLDTWASLTWLASNTSRIRFGPLVCPLTFHHPALLAKRAAAVAELADGRLDLGIGAGWHEGEHAMFGVPFPPLGERMDRFECGARGRLPLGRSRRHRRRAEALGGGRRHARHAPDARHGGLRGDRAARPRGGARVPLTIRASRMDECAQVLELWKSAEAIPRPTDTLPELQRIVREHPDTLLVGEENGRLSGTVVAGGDASRGGIHRLAVLPEFRRRGVAQALVADAQRRLVERGARRLHARVPRDEARARAFWDAAPGWGRDARWQRYTKDIGGPEMAPKPPDVRSAPAKPWRSSI